MKRLTLSFLLSFVFMMCVAPCVFSASIIFQVGDPVPGGGSDLLQVSFNPATLVPPDNITPQIRSLAEGIGESDTENLDVTILHNEAFKIFDNTKVYMVEPGATLNQDGSYTGDQSDYVLFHYSHETGSTVDELHFVMHSDQDPGPGDQRTGYLENGLMQDITAGFGFGTLATDYGIQILAGSDVEATGEVPEPATMLLLGSGLIGLAGYGKKKFFKK